MGLPFFPLCVQLFQKLPVHFGRSVLFLVDLGSVPFEDIGLGFEEFQLLFHVEFPQIVDNLIVLETISHVEEYFLLDIGLRKHQFYFLFFSVQVFHFLPSLFLVLQEFRLDNGKLPLLVLEFADAEFLLHFFLVHAVKVLPDGVEVVVGGFVLDIAAQLRFLPQLVEVGFPGHKGHVIILNRSIDGIDSG